MEHGIKIGRYFHRNQLDQRVSLIGDLNVFELAISLHSGDGRAYDHISLSFSEHHVSNELLRIAVVDFLNHALFAWPDDDRARIPTYAEAHRPRLLSYANKETGVSVERFIHIHIGIGRHDLLTGAAIEPFGYLGSRTDNLKYIDAWQESFNARYGFTSPKNSPRAAAFNGVDVIARIKTQKQDGFALLQGKRAKFEATLQKQIVESNITTWMDFGALLAVHGVVSIANQGRFGEFYSVKLPDADAAIRLKGVFFQRQFIELATDEKVRILRQREKPTYLEQTLPRKEPAHVAALLAEWQLFKAKEFRFVNTGTSFYKNVYLPATIEARLTILNDLESSSHGITRHSTVKNRAITTSANHLPALQILDLDGIRERTEMLLQGDGCVDVRTPQAGVTMGSALRRADPRREKTAEVDGSGTTDPDEWAIESLSSEEGNYESKSRFAQASSVLERAMADLKERAEQSAAQVRLTQIEKRLDCHEFLRHLKASHGLNPSLYRVATAHDGTVRIQCGSRHLTPAEFLTDELGLPWKSAVSIIKLTNEHQTTSMVRMQDDRVSSPGFDPLADEEPLVGAVTELVQQANTDHQSEKSDLMVNEINGNNGLIGKAQSEIAGTAFRLRAKKSRLRRSDYGI